MLEFILKDDYGWDDEHYDYLIKIYNVKDTDATLKVIRDYISFVKENNDFFDDCIINYIHEFLKSNFKDCEIKPFNDIEKVEY